MKTLYMTRDILFLLDEIISTDKLKTLEEDITNLFINHDTLEDRILKNRKKLTRKDVSVIKRIINKQINYDIFPITREKLLKKLDQESFNPSLMNKLLIFPDNILDKNELEKLYNDLIQKYEELERNIRILKNTKEIVKMDRYDQSNILEIFRLYHFFKVTVYEGRNINPDRSYSY